MSIFEGISQTAEQQFVKQNPGMLRHTFGTEDVSPFWIADMDFKVAAPITEELNRLVNRGNYGYELASRNLFTAITNWYKTRHHLKLMPKFFVQVPTVLTGVSLLIREFSNPGDGVLIQTPVYDQFAKLIERVDRRVVESPLKKEKGAYVMDYEGLRTKILQEDVKLILLCNPHNPVGRVWKKAELEKLVEIANELDVLIISDEMHADIIYKGNEFTSITSLEGKHIAMIGSPAKTFGMQSIAEGYIYLRDREMRNQVKQAVDALYIGRGNALTTFATIAAYKQGGPWLDDLLAYLENTIAWIRQYLEKELPMVKLTIPEGTYQLWLDLSELNKSPEELRTFLPNKAKLAVSPGDWYGQGHGAYVRMNIASPLSKVQKAFKQLSAAIHEDL